MSCPRNIIVRSALVAFLGLIASGTSLSQGCPTISIQTPEGLSAPGTPIALTALVKGSVGLGDLKFDWKVSRGVIRDGQGSAKVSVLTSSADSGATITITVSVIGLSPVCVSTASEVVEVIQPIGCIFPVDDFGAEKANDVKARVDNIYIQVSNNADSTAIFEMGFAEDESVAERKLRIKRILNAIKFRKYDLQRSVFVISKQSESGRTRVHIIPPGTEMTYWINLGTFIHGQDIEQKLSTLFQTK